MVQRLSQLSSQATDGKKTNTSTPYEQSLASSFLISADMEHAVHPNYSEKHEAEHRPYMNEGTVVKINANVRYATNSPGIVLLQECAKRAEPASFQPSHSKISKLGGVPLQLLVVRNDVHCGTTVGSGLAAKLGVRAVDIGNAQLAMHSIRETAGAHDLEYAINLLQAFF